MADQTTTPQSADNSKYPWESRTILVATITGILIAAANIIPQAKPIADWISSHGSMIGGVWSLLAIALRAITKDKIVLRD